MAFAFQKMVENQSGFYGCVTLFHAGFLPHMPALIF
jgi:hypothetical protein